MVMKFRMMITSGCIVGYLLESVIKKLLVEKDMSSFGWSYYVYTYIKIHQAVY